jgi:transposase
MIRIRLPEAEARELEAHFRSTQDRKLRDRLQVVLLAHEGRKHQDVAADLRINRRSAQRWLNACCERGLAGLAPRKAKGKEPGIPASLADEIKRWASRGRPSRASTAPTGPTRSWPTT